MHGSENWVLAFAKIVRRVPEAEDHKKDPLEMLVSNPDNLLELFA